jgi:hypothetical protein
VKPMLGKIKPKMTRRKSQVLSPELYIAETGTALGRGAFAGRSYSPGEVVEVCPVILLDYSMKELSLPVQRVVFNWSKLCDSPEKYALVLGCGSIYNHTDEPNMRYSADPENQAMIYTAVREIEQGEQLTVSYNQVPEGEAPRKRNWFEIHGVEKIEIKPGSNGKQEE